MRDKELEQTVYQELNTAIKMTLKNNKDYVVKMQWMKPFLQIISAPQFSQIIKLGLSSLHRFVSIHKSPLSSIAYTERVLNELILVLINCKFEEVDMHDTYNVSILILRVAKKY